jgi:hypothetical protein
LNTTTLGKDETEVESEVKVKMIDVVVALVTTNSCITRACSASNLMATLEVAVIVQWDK